MARGQMSVMFLGTASGGGPSDTRNCSSLICDFLGDYSLWLVDCAEGTLRQFSNQPQQGFRYQPRKVNRIFVTHMHADHIMGIVPFLRGVLGIPEAGTSPSYPVNPAPPRLEIYGPAGLRTFVRQNMKMTLTNTSETYAVHELLFSTDPVTPCNPPPAAAEFDHNIGDQSVMHVSEAPGSDILPGADGFWRVVARGPARASRDSEVVVDAGPIQHRAPCLRYVFTETGPPKRRIVILGDTHDPSEIAPLCMDPPTSLLIHEATDAPIPSHVDEGRISRRDPAEVQRKAILRGHSTPEMAGTFANTINASSLVLNHFGGRFPAPYNSKKTTDSRSMIMREIERQATEAWGTWHPPAVAATDFLRVDIPVLGSAVFSKSGHGQSIHANANPLRSRPAPQGHVQQEGAGPIPSGSGSRPVHDGQIPPKGRMKGHTSFPSGPSTQHHQHPPRATQHPHQHVSNSAPPGPPKGSGHSGYHTNAGTQSTQQQPQQQKGPASPGRSSSTNSGPRKRQRRGGGSEGSS